MNIGHVDDLELDENNWTVTKVYIKLDDSVAKIYGVKGGFMSKAELPLPLSLVGSIGADTIYLTEKITDIDSLREQVESHRSL